VQDIGRYLQRIVSGSGSFRANPFSDLPIPDPGCYCIGS